MIIGGVLLLHKQNIKSSWLVHTWSQLSITKYIVREKEQASYSPYYNDCLGMILVHSSRQNNHQSCNASLCPLIQWTCYFFYYNFQCLVGDKACRRGLAPSSHPRTHIYSYITMHCWQLIMKKYNISSKSSKNSKKITIYAFDSLFIIKHIFTLHP
jgi:hypothetical protein